VPGHTLRRALAPAPPEARGRGRRPRRPWPCLAAWSPALPPDAWPPRDGRDGATGPLVVESVTGPLGTRTPQRQEGHQAMAVVGRSRDREPQEVVQGDCALTHGAAETSRAPLARGAKAAQRIAAGLQRRTSEAGRAEDAGRHGAGWHQHHTLAWIATWC